MRTISMKSRVRHVWQNPIGRDIIHKLLLQMNVNEKWITNPLVGSLSLRTLSHFTGSVVDKDFYQTLIQLLNYAEDPPAPTKEGITRTWWKESVVYQIYPRSFRDSNGDGIGDLGGIISRLDYLKELGVDVIWLSPVYDSPNDDNGYDIRNYYQILAEFGTMEEFDRLLDEVHQRGMRLIMDLVVNHTSDEHPWFQDVLCDPKSPYRDYYLLQKSGDGNPPNNWTSFFGGSAWNYYEEMDLWGLHLFSKKQMDLNWDNGYLREEIHAMIRWWLEKGIDGFRLDVINYISKDPGLPMGNESVGKLMGYYGIEHYFYGPKLHQYLKEMRREAFDHYDVFTVGETPGVGMQMSRLLTAEERKELDMVFSFDQLETPGHVRFDDYAYDLNYLKGYLCDWMENYGDNCWMSLFYENHDNPRMISKVDKSGRYREQIAKLLAVIQMTLKGTPFLYQGQELGRVNQKFTSVSQLKDVESINLYEELKVTVGEDAALERVLAGSRDHARPPMPWSADTYGGFSDHEPWIGQDEDYKSCNVQAELEDPDSVWHFYRKLIGLRRENKALVYGSFRVFDRKVPDLFCYERELDGQVFYVECCLKGGQLKRRRSVEGYKLVAGVYGSTADVLRPYEANLYIATQSLQ